MGLEHLHGFLGGSELVYMDILDFLSVHLSEMKLIQSIYCAAFSHAIPALPRFEYGILPQCHSHSRASVAHTKYRYSKYTCYMYN